MANMTGWPSATGEATDTHRVASTGTKLAPLGLLMCDGFNEYVYVQAGAAIAVNSAVIQNSITSGNFTDVRQSAAASNSPIFGVATAAFASGDFGYVQVRGVATALANAAAAAGDLLVSDSGAAGTFKTAVATDLAGAKGVHALSATSGGKATVYLQ